MHEPEIGGPRGYQGRGLGPAGIWACPACRNEQGGAVEQGCTSCGVGGADQPARDASTLPAEELQARADRATRDSTQAPPVALSTADQPKTVGDALQQLHVKPMNVVTVLKHVTITGPEETIPMFDLPDGTHTIPDGPTVVIRTMPTLSPMADAERTQKAVLADAAGLEAVESVGKLSWPDGDTLTDQEQATIAEALDYFSAVLGDAGADDRLLSWQDTATLARRLGWTETKSQSR